MAFTQQQLDELEKAIASGATRVKYRDPTGEKEVQYRSLEQMEQLRRKMRRELGLDAGEQLVYFRPQKGL